MSKTKEGANERALSVPRARSDYGFFFVVFVVVVVVFVVFVVFVIPIFDESIIFIESAFFAESDIFIESLIAGAGAGAIAAGVVSAALSLVFAHAETASTPAANRAKRFIDVLLRVGLGFEQQWSVDAVRVLVVGG